MGKETISYTATPGTTVGELFEIADRDFNEGEVTRNQSKVYEDTCLNNGDNLFVSKMVKGNADPFDVELHRLSGGRSITLPAMEGYTIRQTLDQMEPELKSQFFRADGTPAYEFRVVEGGGTKIGSLDYVLSRPASGKTRILCAQMMKGNKINK